MGTLVGLTSNVEIFTICPVYFYISQEYFHDKLRLYTDALMYRDVDYVWRSPTVCGNTDTWKVTRRSIIVCENDSKTLSDRSWYTLNQKICQDLSSCLTNGEVRNRYTEEGTHIWLEGWDGEDGHRSGVGVFTVVNGNGCEGLFVIGHQLEKGHLLGSARHGDP